MAIPSWVSKIGEKQAEVRFELDKLGRKFEKKKAKEAQSSGITRLSNLLSDNQTQVPGANPFRQPAKPERDLYMRPIPSDAPRVMSDWAQQNESDQQILSEGWRGVARQKFGWNDLIDAWGRMQVRKTGADTPVGQGAKLAGMIPGKQAEPEPVDVGENPFRERVASAVDKLRVKELGGEWEPGISSFTEKPSRRAPEVPPGTPRGMPDSYEGQMEGFKKAIVEEMWRVNPWKPEAEQKMQMANKTVGEIALDYLVMLGIPEQQAIGIVTRLAGNYSLGVLQNAAKAAMPTLREMALSEVGAVGKGARNLKPKPVIPVGKGGVKEPWMMGKGEYLKSIGWRGEKSTPNGMQLRGISMQKYTRGQKFHERVVESALSEGKPVPPEVLKDYPDLAAKYVGQAGGAGGSVQPTIGQVQTGLPDMGKETAQAEMLGEFQGKGRKPGLVDAEAIKAQQAAKAKTERLRALGQTEMPIENAQAELEGLKATLADHPARDLLSLVTKSGSMKGEVSAPTITQYKAVTSKAIKPSSLTPDGKHVKWEYVLDELASERGYADGDALRDGIYEAQSIRERITALAKASPPVVSPAKATQGVVTNIEQPKVYYHGTPNKFAVFDISKADKAGLYGDGIYFTDSKKIASTYAGAGATGNVKEVNLNPKKIFDVQKTLTIEELDKLPKGVWNSNLEYYKKYPRELPTGQEVYDLMAESFHKEMKAGLPLAYDKTGQTVIDSGVSRANQLLKQAGYDAIAYKGGVKTGGELHNVLVSLDPNIIRQIEAATPPVQPVKAAGKGIGTAKPVEPPKVAASAVDDLLNNPRLRWKSEEAKAQAKASLEEAIAKGEATPESLREEFTKLLGEAAAPPVKPPKKPPTAKAGKAPKADGEFAGNIRLEKYPEELRPAIKEWADANPEEIAKARRGVRSDAQVLEDAKALVEDVGGDFARMQRKWKSGDAWNAEEILALRGTLRAKTESVLAAQKLVQESNSTENLLKLKLALSEQAVTQEAVTGITAESGRALRQFRQDVFAATKANDAAKLEALLKRVGGRDKIEETARLLGELDLNDPGAVNDFIRSLSKPGFWDYVTEIYYNSILSGPKTHIVNSLSNTANTFVSPVERVASAIVEVPLSALQRRARARFFNEVPADAWGAVSGLKDGFRAFASTYKYGISPEQASKFEMRNVRAFKGKLGRVINFPSTLLEAADSLMKSVNYRAAYEATAKRMIGRKGLTGEAAINALAELKKNPTKALLEEAERVAETRLYRAEPGKFTANIMGLRETVDIKGFKPLRYIIPFVRTPANLLKYGLERSPAGWLNPKLWQNIAAKNPEAADQIGRATLGSISAAAIAWYAHEGFITGAAPTSVAERDRFYRDGKQPFAIRIGNKWVSYQRLEPFNQTFALVAAALDAMKDREKDAVDKVGQAVSTIGQNMVSQTYLSGLSDLINAISEPERYAGNILTRFGTALLVPASSLTRTVAQTIDRTVRKPENFGDTLKTAIPGLSQQVPERQTVFGEAVVRQSPAWSPINVTPAEETELTRELDRLKVNIGFTGKSIAGVPLTTKEQADYQRLAGQQIKKNITAVISSSSYKSLNDESKEKAIQAAADKAKETARSIILAGIPAEDRNYRKKYGIPGKESLKAAPAKTPAPSIPTFKKSTPVFKKKSTPVFKKKTPVFSKGG